MRSGIGFPACSASGRLCQRGGDSGVWTPFVPFALRPVTQFRRHLGQEGGGGHHQADVPMPAIPGTGFAMGKAEIVLCALETFLGGPAQTGGTGKLRQPGADRAEDHAVCQPARVPAGAGHQQAMLQARPALPRNRDAGPVMVPQACPKDGCPWTPPRQQGPSNPSRRDPRQSLTGWRPRCGFGRRS